MCIRDRCGRCSRGTRYALLSGTWSHRPHPMALPQKLSISLKDRSPGRIHLELYRSTAVAAPNWILGCHCRYNSLMSGDGGVYPYGYGSRRTSRTITTTGDAGFASARGGEPHPPTVVSGVAADDLFRTAG